MYGKFIEINDHFTYCIAILHITLQIDFCYTYAFHTMSSILNFHSIHLKNMDKQLVHLALMAVVAKNVVVTCEHLPSGHGHQCY